MLLFVVAFALSTDYGVFLFGRIKEGHDHGLATRDAVVAGLERTGRLITAAALLLCVAIGAFVTSNIFFIKQLGVGAALAVAIDATFVRALLLPAMMGMLGERTWWAPAPLRRLHQRIGLREGSRRARRCPASVRVSASGRDAGERRVRRAGGSRRAGRVPARSSVRGVIVPGRDAPELSDTLSGLPGGA